jgi:hypothetical protein
MNHGKKVSKVEKTLEMLGARPRKRTGKPPRKSYVRFLKRQLGDNRGSQFGE